MKPQHNDLCKRICCVPDRFDNAAYYDCNRKVKYIVKYKESKKGKQITERLCGIHYRSILHWVKKMKTRNIDIDFKTEIIN